MSYRGEPRSDLVAARTVRPAVRADRPDITRTLRQGDGFGQAVITSGLATADADRVPVHPKAMLEDVALYEQLGVVVTHIWQKPRGPELWSMPQPAGG